MASLFSYSRISRLLCALLLVWTTGNAGEKLYVFYPTTARQQVVQKALEESCPDIDITVFGRHRDFTTKIELEPPDAVLTRPELIKQITDYTIKVHAVRAGKTVEPLVLLSVDTKVDLSSSADMTIGALDFLGRTGMKDFVGGIISPTPRIKRVTKIEDLLPLLTFNMASAVLISKEEVKHFQELSNLNFAVTPLTNASAGLAACAVKDGADGTETVTAIKALKSDVSALLGVSGWK